MSSENLSLRLVIQSMEDAFGIVTGRKQDARNAPEMTHYAILLDWAAFDMVQMILSAGCVLSSLRQMIIVWN